MPVVQPDGTGYATVADVEVRRPLSSDAERVFAEELLADAAAMLDWRLPTLAARVRDETLPLRVVIAVQTAMVLRVLRNPDGKLEETIDDYRYRRDSATSTGALHITDAELRMLQPTSARSSAGSIRLVKG